MRLRILDRYLLTELSGPFLFGLSAFTLIFAATQILAIGRLVSDQHAPLWAAIEVFVWQLPGIVALVIPMALLLGTLLAIQRLSGESEITAMKAGGIMFPRIVAPMLAAGFVFSLVTLVLQEQVVPFALAQSAAVQDAVINHTSAFGRDIYERVPLPGGGSQLTYAAGGIDRKTQALRNVTVIQYDPHNTPTLILFADRARFLSDRWMLENVSSCRFDANGDTTCGPKQPSMNVQIVETPTDFVKRVEGGNPQNMSRSQIAAIIRSGQLTDTELRKYTTTYWEKLAQPFACFVFVLIAVPFGLRSMRGGGSASLGFGLAVAIVFVYYIVLTIFSYVGEAFLPLAPLWAWMPNIIFTAIGAQRLRKAAAV